MRGPLRKARLALGLFALLGTLPGGPGRAETLPWPDLLDAPFVQEGPGRRLAARFQALESMGFSGVVLAMTDGLVVLHDAYGTRPGGRDSIDVQALFPCGDFERVLAATALVATGSGAAEGSSLDALRAALERASGRPYEDALRALVLVPAGMTRARFRGEATPGSTGSCGALRRLGGTAVGRALLPAFASGVRKAARAARAVDPPSNGLLITAADLYRWELALRARGALPETARAWAAAHTAGTWRSQGYEIAIAREPERRAFGCVLVSSDLGWSGVAVAALSGEGGSTRNQATTFLFLLAALAVIFLSIGTASQVRRRRPGRERRSPLPF